MIYTVFVFSRPCRRIKDRSIIKSSRTPIVKLVDINNGNNILKNNDNPLKNSIFKNSVFIVYKNFFYNNNRFFFFGFR